jgi:type II secretory pathway pseudopilin PulG
MAISQSSGAAVYDHRQLSLQSRRPGSCPAGREGAFTIIELLVVITIIIVLAGLILATSSYVQNKAARSRAETEIAAMSAALESYKADNGIYPSTANTISLTSAQLDSTSCAYKSASLDLYNALTGATTSGSRSSFTTGYFAFKPNQLYPPDQSQPVTYICDPFVSDSNSCGPRHSSTSYGYSTSKNPIANPASYTSAAGNNPTFDLWSTSNSTNPNQWIKNW